MMLYHISTRLHRLNNNPLTTYRFALSARAIVIDNNPK